MNRLFYVDRHGGGQSRVVGNMVACGKQGANDVLPGRKFDFFTGGAIAHMDVVGIFSHWLAQVFWQVHVYEDVVMAFAFIDTFFSWLYGNTFCAQAHFYRAGHQKIDVARYENRWNLL